MILTGDGPRLFEPEDNSQRHARAKHQKLDGYPAQKRSDRAIVCDKLLGQSRSLRPARKIRIRVPAIEPADERNKV
jgi:hypothetical protein